MCCYMVLTTLTSYVFLYGPNKLVQSTIALSTTNAEYMALTKAIKERLWLNRLMKDFDITQSMVKIYYDDQSAVHLSKNPQYHSRTKHIDIKFRFV